MKVKLFLAISIAAAFLSSCATVSKSQVESRTVEASAAVNIVPPTAKVDVNPTKFTDTWVFGRTEISQLNLYGVNFMEQLKNVAASKSMLKRDADVIIAPLYDIDTETNTANGETTYKITIRGYAGKYVDWDKNASTTAIQTTSEKK